VSPRTARFHADTAPQSLPSSGLYSALGTPMHITTRMNGTVTVLELPRLFTSDEGADDFRETVRSLLQEGRRRFLAVIRLTQTGRCRVAPRHGRLLGCRGARGRGGGATRTPRQQTASAEGGRRLQALVSALLECFLLASCPALQTPSERETLI